MTVPFKCVFCAATDGFSRREHLVPQSLGNDFIVLEPGWVCDVCNHTLSVAEGRVVDLSIIGFARTALGVITKKNKPASSRFRGVQFTANPSRPGTVIAHVTKPGPWLVHGDSEDSAQAFFPVQDPVNREISRLLLKMGVELLAVYQHFDPQTLGVVPLRAAADFALGRIKAPWPYVVFTGEGPDEKLQSILALDPEAAAAAADGGFNLFLHEFDREKIMFFRYGFLCFGINLCSPTIAWAASLDEWGLAEAYRCCETPAEE